MFTKREKQVSTLLIAREQLRKPAGEPQRRDGTEPASVNHLAPGALQRDVPRPCQHQRAEPAHRVHRGCVCFLV